MKQNLLHLLFTLVIAFCLTSNVLSDSNSNRNTTSPTTKYNSTNYNSTNQTIPVIPPGPPPKTFEAPIAFDDTIRDWLRSKAIVDLFAPPNDGSRVFITEVCDSCVAFISDLIKYLSTAKHAQTAGSITLAAQTLCTQQGLAKQLGIPCSTFVDLRGWLGRAGLIANDSKPGNLLEARSFPQLPCIRGGICKTSETQTGDTGAVIVRLKFTIDLTTLPHASDKFSVIVKAFIADIAAVLDLPTSRFQLHSHPNEVEDGILELVIKKTPVEAGVTDDNGVLRSESALDIAVRLKSMITTGKSYLHNPPERLTALLDPSYDMKIVPLIITPTNPKP